MDVQKNTAENLQTSAKTGSSGVSRSERARFWKAFLATKHDEFLAPARAIADVVSRLAEDISSREKSPDFHADMVKNRRAARSLLGLIQGVLESGQDDEKSQSQEADADFQRVLRHEMLNDLNTVILCSEMWIEEAEEHFLDSYLPDLTLVVDSAHRCVRLIDEILESSERFEEQEVPADEFRQYQELIQKEPHRATAPPGRILVADDIATNREFLQRSLERLGHQVFIAKTGTEVLDRVIEFEFDLVLLDIKMPELNGIEVLTRMKSNPDLRELPVIMVSALSDIEIVARCIKLGAEDFLPKPFNSVLLKARIEACLEKRRLLLAIRNEEEKTQRLLEVILPPLIIQELKDQTSVTPRRHDNVAVLFADIVGFTSYCESHPPEQVMDRLGRLVEQWEQSAEHYGVEKIKTIGDAFMAAKGLWSQGENVVADCVHCGLEMIATTQELAAPWDLRIGIHVGPVVAGVMGNKKYLFDLWGDTVNMAARMESSGAPGTITLSKSAWQRVASRSRGIPRGLVEIKGKGPQEIFQFEQFRDRESEASRSRQDRRTANGATSCTPLGRK